MKKYLILYVLLIILNPVYAGGVGYINYEKVAENYYFARNSMSEIDAMEKEIRMYLIKKEEEFNKIETPLQKKKFEETVQAELKAKEEAFNSFRDKREEEVYTRIHAVAEKIRMENNLDILLDDRSVFSGGMDITETLIQKLNQTKGR